MSIIACSIENCEKPTGVKGTARGWCSGHYQRFKRHGDPLAGGSSPRIVPGTCVAQECEAPDVGPHGYCGKHWVAWKRYGDPDVRKRFRTFCTVEGCDGPTHGRGLCSAHWARRKRTGDALGSTPRMQDGEANPSWVGADVSYAGAHARVRRMHGVARLHKCVDCGGGAEHWSYNHKDPDAIVGTLADGSYAPFSLKIECYEPRCPACHKRFDNSVTRPS